MRADIAVKIKKDKIKESATAPLCPPNDEERTFTSMEKKERKKRVENKEILMATSENSEYNKKVEKDF